MNHKFEQRVRRIYKMFACCVLVAVMAACPAFAADDPLAVVTNLSDFIFSLIRAIGLILLGFGILQIGLLALNLIAPFFLGLLAAYFLEL